VVVPGDVDGHAAQEVPEPRAREGAPVALAVGLEGGREAVGVDGVAEEDTEVRGVGGHAVEGRQVGEVDVGRDREAVARGEAARRERAHREERVTVRVIGHEAVDRHDAGVVVLGAERGTVEGARAGFALFPDAQAQGGGAGCTGPHPHALIADGAEGWAEHDALGPVRAHRYGAGGALTEGVLRGGPPVDRGIATHAAHGRHAWRGIVAAACKVRGGREAQGKEAAR